MIALYDIDIYTKRIALPPDKTLRRVRLQSEEAPYVGHSIYARRTLTPEEKARRASEDYDGDIDDAIAMLYRVIEPIHFAKDGSIHIEGLTLSNPYSWEFWICRQVALIEET